MGKLWPWGDWRDPQQHSFKQYSIGINVLSVCQENIPHTITAPPPAWTLDTRQAGSMVSSMWCQILTRPHPCCRRSQDLSDQLIFFQSLTVQFGWTRAHCRLRFFFFLFLADMTWSSAALARLLQDSSFVLCILRCILCPFSSVSYFCPQNYCSLDVSFLFTILLVNVVYESPRWRAGFKIPKLPHGYSHRDHIFSHLTFEVNIDCKILCIAPLPNDWLMG